MQHQYSGGEAVPAPRFFRATTPSSARLRAAQEPDDPLDDDAVFALSASLAMIVQMAGRLPEGHPARRALAQAAVPIRDALEAHA